MKTARILHLEDDARDGDLIECLLTTQGVTAEIHRVDNGAAFAAALAEGAFDLILSDFSIPGFGGLEALELARKQCRDKPFVFISGTLGEEVAIDALKRGAADYVLKDRPARLGAAVTRALKVADEARALKHAEDAMIQSEFKYRQLFERLSEAAILMDAETGRVLDANKQAERLLERSRGELIGLTRSHFQSPQTSLACAALLANGSDEARGELIGEILTKQGASVRVAISVSHFILYSHRLVLGLYRALP